MKLYKYIAIMIMFIIGCNPDANTQQKMKTVEKVDLVKYSGVWYEIARFEHSFEKGWLVLLPPIL
jgi:apolipoprotein D and lipocalin family protein